MQNFTFEIDNIKIPLRACLDFSQEYDHISAVTSTRTMNGSAIRQGTYTKLKTTLTGSGGAPVGLSRLNTFISHTLKCSAPLAISSDTNIIILPSERRTDPDYIPVGYAFIEGEAIKTTVVLDGGNTATLGIIDYADEYQVLYVPQLTVHIEPVRETTDRSGRKSWTVIAEEV